MDIVLNTDFNNPLLERIPLPGYFDDFNRSDSDVLGKTSREGRPWDIRSLGSSFAWGIRGSKAKLLSSNSGANFAVADGLSLNGTFRATFSAIQPESNNVGVVARYSSPENHLIVSRRADTDRTWALFARVSNTLTLLVPTGIPMAAGDQVALFLDGGSVGVSVNGSSTLRGEEDRLSGTKYGMACSSSGLSTSWDEISFRAD
jgi:hypothetical protein